MRALARWGIAPFMAAPLGAWALGLGDIELRSALNQPFQAEISLVSATPEDLRGLSVGLASPETFATRGLDRAGFLAALEFRVVKDASGRDVVRVSSREAITEPFITMLVEMSWARGRLLREYTVLLDPPVLLPGSATAPPVQPAQTRLAQLDSPSGAIERQPSAPESEASAPAVAAPAAAAPASVSGSAPSTPRVRESAPTTYGPVQRAETLWAIAERFRPAGVSRNQMMVAVYQSNPQAFAGNMNLLQVGAVLRMPDAEELSALTAAAATNEVQRQTDEWQDRPARAAAGTARTPAAPEPRVAAAEAQPRVRLLPPSEPAAAPAAGAGRTPAAADAGGVRPAAGNDAGGAAGAPTPESRLIEIRDPGLQALQGLANETPPPPAPPAAETDNGSPGVELEAEQLFADESEPPVAQPAPSAAAPPAVSPAARPPIVIEQPTLASRLLEWVATPVPWIGVGVGALLLAAAWYVRRRRQEAEDTGRWDAQIDQEKTAEVSSPLKRQVAPAPAAEASIILEERAPRRRAEDDQDAAGAPGPSASDETLSSPTVINLDQADPVAEADFHMAYGLYDQAAELVTKALELQPDRRDLRLKLLEVFFVWGNKDAFRDAATTLRAQMGDLADGDWDNVVIMGKQICPDDPLFGDATTVASHVDVDLQVGGDTPVAGDAFGDTLGDMARADDATKAIDSYGAPTVLLAEGSPTLAAPAVAPPHGPFAKVDEKDADPDSGERTAAELEATVLFDDAHDDGATVKAPDVGFDTLAVTRESPIVEPPLTTRDESQLAAEYSITELSPFDAPPIEAPTLQGFEPDSPTVETRALESFEPDSPTIETRALEDLEPESPTIETRALANLEPDSPTIVTQALEGLEPESPTLDTRALESLEPGSPTLDTRALEGFGPDTPTLETSYADAAAPTAIAPHGSETPTVSAPYSTGLPTETTAEIQLDDLGLDIADLQGLPSDLGDLPGTIDITADTRVQSLLDGDEDLLSAGGVTEVSPADADDDVAERRTAILTEDDATLLAPGDDSMSTATELLSDRIEADESERTSLVRSLPADLDLNLDDPSAALQIDPQATTEVGTKLDLARAYIDMGDPEGARSILGEVLQEGDDGQRHEAQRLMDALSA